MCRDLLIYHYEPDSHPPSPAFPTTSRKDNKLSAGITLSKSNKDKKKEKKQYLAHIQTIHSIRHVSPTRPCPPIAENESDEAYINVIPVGICAICRRNRQRETGAEAERVSKIARKGKNRGGCFAWLCGGFMGGEGCQRGNEGVEEIAEGDGNGEDGHGGRVEGGAEEEDEGEGDGRQFTFFEALSGFKNESPMENPAPALATTFHHAAASVSSRGLSSVVLNTSVDVGSGILGNERLDRDGLGRIVF